MCSRIGKRASPQSVRRATLEIAVPQNVSLLPRLPRLPIGIAYPDPRARHAGPPQSSALGSPNPASHKSRPLETTTLAAPAAQTAHRPPARQRKTPPAGWEKSAPPTRSASPPPAFLRFAQGDTPLRRAPHPPPPRQPPAAPSAPHCAAPAA